MPEHTPGPWRIQCGEFVVADLDDGIETVADTFSLVSNDRQQANARLIAAAPKLLKACKTLMGMFEDAGVTDTVGYDMARKAIAEAEGGGGE
jgi:hypothetical protein